MSCEKVVLSMKAKQVKNEIDKNNYVGLSDKYLELVDLIGNKRFSNTDWINYVNENKAMLNIGNLDDNENEVLNNINAGRFFDLVVVNIPRQVSFCRTHGVDLECTSIFETCLLYASKQADAHSIKTSGVYDSNPAKINSVIFEESNNKSLFASYYNSLDEKGKSDFKDYINYCKEFSEVQSARVMDLGNTERLCHHSGINTCLLALDNVSEIESASEVNLCAEN